MSGLEFPSDVSAGDVLLHKIDRELWHVMGVWKSLDDNHYLYELECDTHTTQHYWRGEDVKDCFIHTGESCDGKPKHELPYWYE